MMTKSWLKMYRAACVMRHVSNMSSIKRNTIVQIAGKAVSSLLGLAAITIMTRRLGAEKFGWYITAIGFLQFFGVATDFGMIPVTAKMLAETDDGEKPRLIKNLLGFRLSTAVIAFVAAPTITLFLPYPTPIKLAIALVSVAFLGNAAAQIFTGYFQTKLQMSVYAASDVLSRLTLLAGVILAAWARWEFFPIMAIVAAASIIQTTFLWFRVQKSVPIGLAFDRAIWKKIMVAMWPVAVSILFNVVYLRGDAVILPLFRTQAEVGLYGAAYRVIDIAAQIAMMVMGVVLPLLAGSWSRGLIEEFRKHYREACRLLLALSIVATLGAYLFAGPIMRVIGGAAFAGAQSYLRILCLAMFGVFLGAVFGHTALAIGRQKETIWVYASDAALSLAGYLFFIPHFGAIGAASVSAFSELYAGIGLFFVVRRYLRRPNQ